MFSFLLLCSTLGAVGQEPEKEGIHQTLDTWHRAASEADFDTYFDLLTEDAVFVGTDATEVWGKAAFMAFSKPYFDRGKAWSFTAVQRNIYVDSGQNIAWFDELLDTWMLLCRGSGVLKKVNGEWKISHYVLSITIPNDEVNPVIALKKENDSTLLQTLIRRD
jgi:ketosteroid isomerase-like protein